MEALAYLIGDILIFAQKVKKVNFTLLLEYISEFFGGHSPVLMDSLTDEQDQVP